MNRGNKGVYFIIVCMRLCYQNRHSSFYVMEYCEPCDLTLGDKKKKNYEICSKTGKLVIHRGI